LDSTLPDEETRRCILDLTQKRGADIGLEFSGYPEAIELGVRLLREGGRFVMAGATFPARPVQLLGEQLVRRLLQIIGVYNYQPEDMETALAFLSQSQGRYPFAELVGKTFSLDEANAAFDYAQCHRPPRVAVLP
jgi:alcohol dehydrogenase